MDSNSNCSNCMYLVVVCEDSPSSFDWCNKKYMKCEQVKSCLS